MRSNLKLKLETNQISATQYGRISNAIAKLEKMPIGNRNIDKITYEEIQMYLNSVSSLSNSSIKKNLWAIFTSI